MNKAKISFLKSISLCFILNVFFGFFFLISNSFSSPVTIPSEENESHIFNLFLTGVIVSKDNSSSTAILRNGKEGKTIILTTGESIFDLKLIHVFEDRIVLRREEKTFQVFLGRNNLIYTEDKEKKRQDEIVRAVQEDNLLNSNQSNSNSYLRKMEFIRSAVKRRIENELPLIIKETRFIPNYVDGKICGFKIINLPQKSILSEVGIYENDIIKKVNGIGLNDMKTLFWLYNEIKDDDKIEVGIERNGKLFHILYIFK